MLTLDFGRSYTYSVPVIDLVARTRRRLAAAGDHGAVPVHGDRHSRRHLFRRAARPRRRHADHGRRAARRRRPQFLVRAAPDLRLRGLAAAGAGRRLSRLERRRLAGPQGADPAGRRAGAAAGGDPRPRHPLGAARSARRGLYPHRARQGPAAPRRAVAARAAQRDDPGADHPRPAVRLPARRHDHHRERLLPARPRPAGLPGDHPARPDRRRKRRHAAGRRGHRRQPAGRPLLCHRRSATEDAR